MLIIYEVYSKDFATGYFDLFIQETFILNFFPDCVEKDCLPILVLVWRKSTMQIHFINFLS